MSMIYDNWERLVAAVLKKEQLWQLFHDQSRSPSISSESSGYNSFSFDLASSLDDVPFSFSSPEKGPAFVQKEDDIAIKIPSSNLKKNQNSVESLSADKNVTFAPSRKRDLKIEVPKREIRNHGQVFRPNISPRIRTQRAGEIGWPDDAKKESYPLPLPLEAISNSSPFPRPNSASASPLRSPERAENLQSLASPWKKGKLLGKGLFGDVYLGFNSEKGEICAMKEIKLSSANSKQAAMVLGKDMALLSSIKHPNIVQCYGTEMEMALLSSIKHPNIVQCYGTEMVGDRFYMYFEYMSGGSLYMILQQYGKLGESAIRNYTQQILSGLAYLHSKHIVHRDIKGANILVDTNRKVKLINYGIEKQIAGKSHPSLLMDSPYWMAPEVIMNSNVKNPSIDIWSLGCTILEMATSKPPLSFYDSAMCLFKIANHKELPRIPDHLSNECKDFVRRCLQWNPQDRATASQLLEHPFVKSSSPLGKQIPVSASSGYPAVKPEGIDHTRSLHQDSGKLAVHSSRAPKSNLHTNDICTQRNTSARVSPVGSPLPHPRSPHHLSGQTSPLPISSPCTASSSSTPITGGIGAIPYSHLNQTLLPLDTFLNLQKHSPSTNRLSYWDPNILRGVHSGSPLASSDDDALQRAANGQPYEQSVSTRSVSLPFFRAPVKLNTLLI